MRISVRYFLCSAAICVGSLIFGSSRVSGQDPNFHNASPSSAQQKNPYAGQAAAIAAGAKLYATNCSVCHGTSGQGTGNIPAVSHGATQTAPDGEVFWFLTTGSIEKGRPAWSSLSEQRRWQIVLTCNRSKTLVAHGTPLRAGPPNKEWELRWAPKEMVPV